MSELREQADGTGEQDQTQLNDPTESQKSSDGSVQAPPTTLGMVPETSAFADQADEVQVDEPKNEEEKLEPWMSD